MNIKKFGINYYELKKKELVYLILLLMIISIGIFGLWLFKTTVYYEYNGNIQGDFLEINDLETKDLDVILNSLEITINSQKIEYEVVEIQELNSLYLLILKVNTKGISVSSNVTLRCVLEEENLLSFIFETIKGGIING